MRITVGSLSSKAVALQHIPVQPLQSYSERVCCRRVVLRLISSRQGGGVSPTVAFQHSVLSRLMGFLLLSHSITAKPIILIDLSRRQQSCLFEMCI